MPTYIDSYPVRIRRRVLGPHYYQHTDAVEPEADPYAPYPVLDDCTCPMCGEGFMSDDEIAQASGASSVWFFHRKCLTAEGEELLEALDFEISTKTGAYLEENT